MTEKWIVVTGTRYWGPFDTAGEAGEFLDLAYSSLVDPKTIIRLSNSAKMAAELVAYNEKYGKKSK